MSKISVFKFNLNGQNKDNIENIILNYLSSRGFYFNQEKQFYVTGKPADTANNVAASIALSAATSILTGSARGVAITGVQRGFEYKFEEDNLIIKAYLYNAKYGSKNMIHSTLNNSQMGTLYNADLKNSLFQNLKDSYVTLMNTEAETVNDGSGKKLAKTLLMIFGITILAIIIFIYVIMNYI